MPPKTPSAETPKKRRATGPVANGLIHKYRKGNFGESLSEAKIAKLAEEMTGQFRVSGSSAVYESGAGQHEWIPTDLGPEVLEAGGLWPLFWTRLRSPTYLLLLNPESYCSNPQQYRLTIETAAGHVRDKTGKKVDASELGLVGHSGGLAIKGKALTQFQSNWHDSLRNLFRKHAEHDTYLGYCNDLGFFIEQNFLFFSDTNLPLYAAKTNGVSNDDILKAIRWDLTLSTNQGNPKEVPAGSTLYEVAKYLNDEWQDLWAPMLVKGVITTSMFPS